MDEFVAFSLVEWNNVARRYRLHDLVRDFAETRLTEEEGFNARLRHARHYKDVLGQAEKLYLQGHENVQTGLRLYDVERSNILVGQTWTNRNMEADETVAGLCWDYPGAGMHVIDLRLHARERIAWLEPALKATRRLGDRRGEGAALGNLGLAYADLGETRRAIEFHEQALEIARETGDRREEGIALGNLGLAHADLGETRRAIEYYRQDLEIARETGNRRGEGATLGNLGIAYKNLGETRRAIEFHEQHLGIARETGNRQEEGIALGNLGKTYAVLGETQRAMEYYGQALEIALETGDRLGEGIVLYNRAEALGKLGRTAEAIAHAEATLKLFESMESHRAEATRQLLARLREQTEPT